MSEHPLKRYRDGMGLSQQALGVALGVERITVHRWESGKRKPGREHLPRIIEVTGIPARDLRPDLVELLEGA